MASTKDIIPEVLDMFDLANPYIVDQSFGVQQYTKNPANGGPTSDTLTFDLSRDGSRLADLTNSYINIGLTITIPNAAPNMQVALSNNALMHLFNRVTLEINGTLVEEINTAPGIFTTMQNLLWYCKEYSKSPNALTENCWQLDDHGFFTTYAQVTPVGGAPGYHALGPNWPISSADQAAYLSSGMDNCVNGIPNQVAFATNGSDNANQVEAAYVDTLGPNTKFSSGFKARHDILFNQLLGTNDSSTSIVPVAGTNSVKVTFKLMLSHIFMSLKSIKKLIRGGQIKISLQKDSNVYKAFNIDRTPLSATAAELNQSIQTWPPSQRPTGAGAAQVWSKFYNNVTSPWKDLNSTATLNFDSSSITWNDASLYLRIVQPKYTVYSEIYANYVEDDKPVFYNSITTKGSIFNLTTASEQTAQLATSMSGADYLIFAFQINP
jgi:hypothetical protein